MASTNANVTEDGGVLDERKGGEVDASLDTPPLGRQARCFHNRQKQHKQIFLECFLFLVKTKERYVVLFLERKREDIIFPMFLQIHMVFLPFPIEPRIASVCVVKPRKVLFNHSQYCLLSYKPR